MQRRIFWNTALSGVQVVVNGIAMIVLYRLVYGWLGSALGGVWGLVLAWTSAAGVASLGLAGGVTRFVALYDTRGDAPQAARMVETAMLTVGLVLLPTLALAWPLVGWLLARIYGGDAALLAAALDVLPYALASFWLTSIALVALSGIDGLQRVAVRNVLVMAGAISLLALALWRVPRAGLVGLAQAQVGQNALLLIAAWTVLGRLMPARRRLLLRWRWADLREMLGYGAGVQAISASYMLFEPVTKGLIAAYNPGAVFFFDMAHKLVSQVRAVVATAHAALVPTLTAWHETDAARTRRFYADSCRAMLLIVAVGWPVLAGAGPYVSALWLGTYEPFFAFSLATLATGWMLNLLVNPAYYDNMGSGGLAPNVVGHVLIGVLNAGLGWLGGWWLGPEGVVVAFVVALLAGSGYILWQYERSRGLRVRAWLEKGTLMLLAGNAVVAAGVAWSWYGVPGARAWWIVPLAVGWLTALAPFVLRHPLARKLTRQARPAEAA